MSIETSWFINKLKNIKKTNVDLNLKIIFIFYNGTHKKCTGYFGYYYKKHNIISLNIENA